MKTVAAHDWWQTQGTAEAKPAREKHPFDVYLLVAMLTEEELQQCAALQKRYAGHEHLQAVHTAAVEFFGAPDAPGFLQACRIAPRALDFQTFREAYYQALGL